jgi:CubicO group peptidase (beta-lactamase class C family)
MSVRSASLSFRCVIMISLILAGGLCGCRTSSQTSPPSAAPDDRRTLAKRLDAAVLARPGFFGSVLVALGDDVLLHRGYGRDMSGREIELDTPFWVASISKQFTAAAILKLRDQGRLSVDDSINRFLIDVPDDKRVVSIRQLLTHTSGLGQNYAADGIIDRAEAVAAILARPLERPPGEGFRYANDNYNLLAAIVEIASGERFEEYLRNELFDRAAMQKTSFWGELPDAVAAVARPVAREVSLPNWGYRGAVGIASTSGDLLRWVRVLMAGSVLSRPSVVEMLVPAIDLGKGRWYGYGWFSSIDDAGQKTIWTRGYEQMGHGGYVSIDPDGRWVVIVLSSAGAGGGNDGFPLTHVIGPDLESIVRSSQLPSYDRRR